MDTLLRFYPTIVSLCEKLSFQELKSLSRVSKGWWELTSSFVVNRTVIEFNAYDKPCEIEFLRKYKHVKINNIALSAVLDKLPDSLETLKLFFSQIQVQDFRHIQRFKKFKSLSINYPEFLIFNEDSLNPVDLMLGLQSLEVCLYEDDLSVYQKLIHANGSIRSLSLYFTTSDEDTSEGAFNDFLRSIRLPNLLEFAIEARNIDLADGLRVFIQNHKDLTVCSLTNLEIKDDVISNLRRTCEKLEKVSLEGCLELTGVSLKELKRMKALKHLDLSETSFAGYDLEKFRPRQLESFKICYSEDAAIEGLTSVQFQSMISLMRNIRVLNLSELQTDSGDPVLDCSILPLIAKQMPHLIDLNLSSLFLLWKEVAGELNFNRLEKLDLSYSDITFKLLRLVKAPKLKVLIANHADVNSKGVKHMVDNSPLLEQLHLANCKDLFETDLTYITENLSLLRILDCKGCTISEACFKRLLLSSSIEECKVSMCGDFREFAKWKEGFEAIEYTPSSKCRSKFRHLDSEKLMITNGARSFFIS